MEQANLSGYSIATTFYATTMPLHVDNLAEAIQELARQTARRSRQGHLERARGLLRELQAAALQERIDQVKERVPWLVARPTNEPPGATFPLPERPENHTVIATDGSHMAPDRHSPVRFIVLNIGRVRIHYGARAWAHLSSRGVFWYRDEDLHVADTDDVLHPIEGALLGTVMALHELEALADEAQNAEYPGIALRDGSLIFWHMQNEDPKLQAALLPQITRALRRFHDMGIPVASYISYPGARDLVNSLRVWLCGSCARQGDCTQCRECDEEAGSLCTHLRPVRDRELFMGYLHPGERSAIFESSSALQEKYRDDTGMDHRIQFFYVHTGTEIARVEAPRWVMETPSYRDLVHALVVDQCRRGHGYPPALQEAHEQAVITTEDRRMIEVLVEQALARMGIPYVRSMKDWSKRVRGI